MMKTRIRSTLVIASALAFIGAAIAPTQAMAADVASASGGASGVADELPPELLQRAYSDLVASAVPRTRSHADVAGIILTTFTLPTGSELTFTMPEVTAELGGGWDERYGLYVEFNRTDQGVLLAGGGGALAVAMCAIPGVGIPLCIVAGGVVAAATTALAAHGLCRNIMRVYAQMLGYPECR
ncbi:hypothetical protein [Agromyces aerolatus]|uniref:hypothetical protein n=1 Tax=Agromyces sp. LY-1074 TaxID=3074080 RepID=UPI002854A8B1|nr:MULTISPECIES: hypothetical protein [unclassified Agromyces]MDR5701695.1 hypothetical protein [Agromyces sp. LY-1074]MDR5707958.1 hypothetical protein [Agromyces sp. LY-1358]